MLPTSPHRRTLRRAATLAAVPALLAGWCGPAGAATDTGQEPSVPPFTIHLGPNFTLLPAPLTTTQCQSAYGIACYSAGQLETAYNTAPLFRRGIDGRGTTVVIAIPYGSPTIQHDLHVYDQTFGLPDPRLRIEKFGDVPAYDPANPFMVELAAGTSELVEETHALAPGATIVVAETTISGDAQTAGLPELMQAEQTLADEGVGDVFEQIFSTGEGTIPGVDQGDFSGVYALRNGFEAAAAHHATTVVAAGDLGPTEYDADGNLSTTPSVLWPASDPLVTSVGGAQFDLDDAGQAVHPPTGWNDGFGGAGAGGLSEVFPAPSYQAGVASTVDGHRGVPDISGSAAVNGGNWIYTSFAGAGAGGAGWDILDATGGAVAQFSGIVALADQAAGHRLGQIDPALYALGGRSRHGDRSTGLVDVTEGDNSLDGVTGYSAGPGYDLDSGWGTVDAALFVPALARAAGNSSPAN